MIDRERNITGIRLHVGSIPATASELSIRQYFDQFGPVMGVKIFYNSPGKSGLTLNKGYCHILVSDQATADVILQHSSHYFQDRIIQCSPYQRGHLLKQNNAINNLRRVVAKMFPQSANEKDLYKLFGAFGPVENAFFLQTQKYDSDQRYKTASILFKRPEDAESLVQRGFVYYEQYLIKLYHFQHDHGRKSSRRTNDNFMLENKLKHNCSAGQEKKQEGLMGEAPALGLELEVQPMQHVSWTLSKQYLVKRPVEHKIPRFEREMEYWFNNAVESDFRLFQIKPTMKAFRRQSLNNSYRDSSNIMFRLLVPQMPRTTNNCDKSLGLATKTHLQSIGSI